MNKSEFEELTNLYFDQEISDAELARLKKELAARADRWREFQLRYRLHNATCSVLSSANSRFLGKATSKVSGTHRTKNGPSLILGLGMAACFLVLLTTSILIIRQPVNNIDTFVAKTSDSPDELNYAEKKKPELPFQGNLSSQLRLAGLTPDISPSNQQLSRVDMKALRQREARLQDMIEQIDQYKTHSAIPEPQLVESFECNYSEPFGSYWPAGFKSSLASFK